MADVTIPTSSPPVAPPPGLMNSTETTGEFLRGNQTAPTAGGYHPSTYQATPYTVSPDATVASQVKGLIDENSPLMQRAAAQARDQAQSRGLMNTSMAVTAGQAGMIDAALPIATADAATYDRAATNTATARNTASSTNANARNAAGSSYMTQQNSLQQTRMNNESAVQIQQMQNDGNLKNILSQGMVNQQLQTLNNTNKLQLQTSASAAQLYSQSLQFMAGISTDPNLSPEQKAAALNNSVAQLSDALHVMSIYSSMPDVQSMLHFNVPPTSGSGGSQQQQGFPNIQVPGFNTVQTNP